MKVAIVNSMASFLDFFLNLARYMKKMGFDPVFINPDKFVIKFLKKYNIKYENYKKVGDIINFYSSDSDLIVYESRLFNIKNIRKLVCLKNKLFSQSYNFFKTTDFDHVLIFNGAMDVESDVCKDLSLNTFYLEQGYFPDTMQMDKGGVNCKTNFSDLSYDEFLEFHYKENNIQLKEDFEIITIKYSKLNRYFLRFLERKNRMFFLNYLKRNINLIRAKKQFNKSAVSNIDFVEKEKYIFFPLQVNSDTQIILNSRYKNMYEAVNDVLPDLLKTGLKIIIKGHPFEVEPVDYTELKKHKQVIFLEKADINSLIDKSEFVVNVNSSVGLQAISRYKRVLLLGDSFYKNAPVSLNFEDIKGKNIIEEMKKIKIDKLIVDKYIGHFKNEIFINGHFNNLSPEFLYSVTQRFI